jgi:Holliday junction DNA helicase RuvA
MIGRLRGKVSCAEDHVIVDVGGVGYLVHCSTKNLSNLIENEYYQFFIETHVREDHINLYGFLSIDEKHTFTMLLSVNGIGPRIALAILSHLTPYQISISISARDKDVFKAVTGVGAKMAERIIIELKDKLPGMPISLENMSGNGNHNMAMDAISALVNLGINKTEAQNIVSTVLASQPDVSIDELIRLAFKYTR